MAGRLLTGTVGTLLVKALGTVLNQGRGLVLAALMGAGPYGAYAYALSWMTVLGRIASVGLPLLAVREVARARDEGWTVRAFLRWGVSQVLMFGAITGLLLAMVLALAPVRHWPPVMAGLPYALALPPALALLWLVSAIQRGLSRVVLSQLGPFVLVPGGMIAGALLLSLGGPLDAGRVLVLHQFVLVLVTLGLLLHLWRGLPPATEASSTSPARWRVNRTFATIGVVSTLQVEVGTLVVGSLAGPEEAALFDVANRAAALVAFLMTAVTIPLAPMVAELHRRDDGALARAVRVASRWSLLGALAVTALFALLAPWMLDLLGDRYDRAYLPLLVLCAGQIVNAAFGPLGWVLNMTGHERYSLYGMVVGTGIQTGLGLLLAGPFGALGGALASAMGLVAWRLLLVHWARRLVFARSSR